MEPGSAQFDRDQEVVRKAADHGINVFRNLLEDSGEHYEDALRIGMQAAASEAFRAASDQKQPESGDSDA